MPGIVGLCIYRCAGAGCMTMLTSGQLCGECQKIANDYNPATGTYSTLAAAKMAHRKAHHNCQHCEEQPAWGVSIKSTVQEGAVRPDDLLALCPACASKYRKKNKKKRRR